MNPPNRRKRPPEANPLILIVPMSRRGISINKTLRIETSQHSPANQTRLYAICIQPSWHMYFAEPSRAHKACWEPSRGHTMFEGRYDEIGAPRLPAHVDQILGALFSKYPFSLQASRACMESNSRHTFLRSSFTFAKSHGQPRSLHAPNLASHMFSP